MKETNWLRLYSGYERSCENSGPVNAVSVCDELETTNTSSVLSIPYRNGLQDFHRACAKSWLRFGGLSPKEIAKSRIKIRLGFDLKKQRPDLTILLNGD